MQFPEDTRGLSRRLSSGGRILLRPPQEARPRQGPSPRDSTSFLQGLRRVGDILRVSRRSYLKLPTQATPEVVSEHSHLTAFRRASGLSILALAAPCSEGKTRLLEHGTWKRVQNHGAVSLGFPESQRHRHPPRKSIFLSRISAASGGVGVCPHRTGLLLREMPLQPQHLSAVLTLGLSNRVIPFFLSFLFP